MTIAILYICTGRYNQFFSEFYKSCEKYFLSGIEKQYFVFTDKLNLSDAENVHLIKKECAGFPADSLFRFEMFLNIKSELSKFNYIYFFNSNALFLQPVGTEILPNSSEKLVAAEWPGKRKPFKWSAFYPYERNKKSTAYIPPFEQKKYTYYMGGINGGISSDYIQLIEKLANNIRTDYNNGIIAIVHDESHLNKYLRSHTCKTLSSEYCMPEEWIQNGFFPKIIFRDKVKIDPYFNKGRDHSIKGKIKKGWQILWRAIKWYI